MSSEPRIKEMPDQMPGWLKRIDDPWGISWRVINMIKRFDAKRTARLIGAMIRGVDYHRPIFIIGVPRSGTTMLWHLLRASDQLASLPREGHDLWRTFHHPRYSGWHGDSVGAGQVRPLERRYVKAYFYAHFGARRFVEKTPENALRIPYLRDLFPDAIFLVIKRSPPDVINSLITGWRHPQGRYRAYYIPVTLEIPGYDHHKRWCFSLIDGWREYIKSPIPEIAYAQWEAYTRAFEAGRKLVPADQWHELHFEHLLDQPAVMLDQICAWTGITPTDTMRAKLDHLIAEPINALSVPATGSQAKWQRDNFADITPLLPRIANRAPALGYHVDPQTGSIDIIANQETFTPL